MISNLNVVTTFNWIYSDKIAFLYGFDNEICTVANYYDQSLYIKRHTYKKIKIVIALNR